jgi:hypothetical protein
MSLEFEISVYNRVKNEGVTIIQSFNRWNEKYIVHGKLVGTVLLKEEELGGLE